MNICIRPIWSFPKGASYIDYIDSFKNDETKGYIIRCFANVQICINDGKRKIAIGRRTLEILQDKKVQESAPSLPWDLFIRKTHQQMSANRTIFSRTSLTPEDSATVLNSCNVFYSEQTLNEHIHDVRFVWAYYDMLHMCGFISDEEMLKYLESIIEDFEIDDYSDDGQCVNISLTGHYSYMCGEKPELYETHKKRIQEYNQRMVNTVLNLPYENINDYFLTFLMKLTVLEYVEVEGAMSYKDLIRRIIVRYAPLLYVNNMVEGDIAILLTDYIMKEDPSYFDGIKEFDSYTDINDKHEEINDYLREGCLYSDIGLLLIGYSRRDKKRDYLEDERNVTHKHAMAGHRVLSIHETTKKYADLALGHHSYYEGSKGYPEEYVRLKSDYRLMVDIVSVVSYICKTVLDYKMDFEEIIDNIRNNRQKQFSPLLIPYFDDDVFAGKIKEILDTRYDYHLRSIYEELKKPIV
ncbi:MAG: hypothetical protein Q4D13_02470 [Erysipelotrichaceae bacterium]|nr:hypothetical protein [Erysipelotrichaceae bacterium]